MKESSCFAAVWDRVSGDDWGLMADAVSTQSSGLETSLRRDRNVRRRGFWNDRR